MATAAAETQHLLERVESPETVQWVIALHGGAGGAQRQSLPEQTEQGVRRDLRLALQKGAAVLADGGRGPDAIVAALSVLEDSPRFNAGRGAALDEHGAARHDASIMRGEDRGSGAIAGSSRIKNPIVGAQAVMNQTANVLLNGAGADWFAQQSGLALVDPRYFVTDDRLKALSRVQQRAQTTQSNDILPDDLYGTVGAVVLDSHGNLAAGTSTGGRTNKRFGRIGDSPIVGAGTYASNESCAVSATGHGEYFIRWTVARDICARVEFARSTLDRAVATVLFEQLLAAGGTGGVVSILPGGLVVFGASTANMRRGVMTSGAPARVAVYSDELVTVLSDTN
ncbi:MAG: isoaspartyl peptidase/L-asparaginase [Pseudomonadota bacterium]